MREYDLILGILACQLRVVSRDSLVRTVTQSEEPDTALPELLRKMGTISDREHDLLTEITETIIRANEGDVHAALDAIGGENAVRAAFASSVRREDISWVPDREQTILADSLPHGLPAEIAPESVGRYTGGSEYARGGIGRILLVHDEQLGRDIILKELLPHHTVSHTAPTLSKAPGGESPGSPMRQSASMLARFLQEAKITGQLEHPSIVPVYELGLRRDGQLYYTMKLVRGDTLSAAIKACGGLDSRLALLRFYLDICQAIAYAHAKGVLHRDLKPSNIMVGEFGECVVLDWGLAKMKRDTDAHQDAMEKSIRHLKLPPEEISAAKTRDKEILGTPLYMAPEQARGEIENVDYHSDVYSLGVILYEILTGDLPHPWSTTEDTVSRVGSIPAPSITKRAPDTPPELAAICDKALRFEPGDRYPSAAELATEVQRFLEGAVVEAYAYKATDVLKRVYKRHKTFINTAAAAAILLVVLGSVSYINIMQARDRAEAARAEAETQRDEAAAQRERAEAAEERTAREKYVSDIRLADAYVRDYKFQAAEDTLLATDPRYRNLEWDYLIAACNQELATLRGHTRDVYAVISHGGERILTMSGDRTAKLWDASTEQALFTWSFPDAIISDGAFSPDDQQVAIWMHNGNIHLYDRASGEEIRTWPAHTMRILHAAFDSQGDRIITSGADHAIRVWDVGTSELLLEIQPQTAAVYRVRFSNDDTRILAGPAEGPPVLYSAVDGTPVATPDTSARLVTSGGNAVFTVAGPELTRLSASDLSEQWRVSLEDTPDVTRYFPAQDKLLTALANGTVQLRNGADGQLIQAFNFKEPVKAPLLNHAGNRVIVVSRMGRIVLYDTDTSDQIAEFAGHESSITKADIAPDDSYLLTASRDGTARKWSLENAPGATPLAWAPPDFVPASLSGDGLTMAMAAAGDQLRVVDLGDGDPVYQATLPIFRDGGRANLNTDGTLLGVVLDEFLPVVLSLPDGNVIAKLHGHEGPVTSIRFSPDSTEVVTSSWDQTARIWNTSTGELLTELQGHENTVRDARFAPNGLHLATVSNDKTARVWDRASGAMLFEVKHEGAVTCCAFSADGNRFASGSEDGSIQIWDIPGKRVLFELSGQLADIQHITFSSDGNRLVCNTGQGAESIWDTHLGLLLTTLPSADGYPAPWRHFHGATDGSLSGTRDGTVLRHTRLSDATSILNREGLDAALAERREQYAPRPDDANRTEAPGLTDVFLPAPALARLLEHLKSLRGTGDSDKLTWIEDASTPNIHPLTLMAGDVILAVGDRTPATLFAPENAAVLDGLLDGAQSLRLDLLRGDTVLRFTLRSLQVQERERTITLEAAQAEALLRAALDVVRNNAMTVRQVSQQSAAERGLVYEIDANTVSGIAIPSPKDVLRKKMLQATGLAADVRITSIADTATPAMAPLRKLLEDGLASVESSPDFSLPLQIERGVFDRVNLTISSAP